MSLRIVPYDAGRHGAFVHGTMRGCLGDQWPWNLMDTGHVKEMVTHAIAGGTTLVAEVELDDDPDAFAGWACTNGNDVVFAYTRHAYRRRFHCMSTMLIAAGIDVWQPVRKVGVRFWTRSAQRIHLAKGWPIYWKVTE